MVQGLLGRNGNGNHQNGYHPSGANATHNNYIDYLAEARKCLTNVEELGDEQAYQTGLLNALIGIGYELRKVNKYNRINQ